MLIREFAAYTGVSVRTLHYYDEMGLLTPAYVDEHTGYRWYDEQSLLRMQSILFYRELDFPLKSIREILSSPEYDQQRALSEQKKLLTLKKERLERLIAAIDNAAKGENIMTAFDNSEFEQYQAEAKEKWGNTAAYGQFAEKTKNYSGSNWQSAADGLNAVFAAFAQCKQSGYAPTSAAAQEIVKQLQDFITANYYPCTNEILQGLGQMYVADERFARNIDKNDAGTAEYAGQAIAVFTRK